MIVPNAPYLIPLSVAVSGHRNIPPAAEDDIRRAITERFSYLQELYKIPQTPLRALSGLAEGADMVFAEAALALDIEVVAVLPTRPEIFARDFEHPAHEDRQPAELKQRFWSILERCADTVVVAEEGDPARYDLVGSYLARHSHLLFALWDGDERNAETGTGQVMRFFREGVPDPQRPLNAPESKPVHYLRVPRGKEESSLPFEWDVIDESPLELPLSEENPAVIKLTHRTMEALNRFNDNAADLNNRHGEAVELSLARLAIDRALLSKTEGRILQVYAMADALAISLQKRSLTLLTLLFGIGLLMVLAFELYAHKWESPVILGAYFLGLSAAAWLIYFQDKKKETHARFLDYRGLAEGLRVQLFWRLAGLTTPEGLAASVADHYLRKQSGELTWIRAALQAVNVGPPRKQPLLEPVEKQWIRDQAGYFEKASRQDGNSLQWFKWWARFWFGAGLAAAGIALVVEIGWHPQDNVWMHGLILLMGLFPAAAALLHSYTDHRGLPQHCKQYDRMRIIFGRAVERLDSQAGAGDSTAFTRLVQDLGEEALSENADWILLHRERPIELLNQ